MAGAPWFRRSGLLLLAVVCVLLIGASLVLAEAPTPNPLAGGSTFSKDIGYLNIQQNGPAATIHGDPIVGRTIFTRNCAACHGEAGIGGIPNPGSDDGTVPPLNPADLGFAGDTPGDAATFARNIDLFVQHGSKPSGDNPAISMPGWGDTKQLTQQQIADVEAYIMQLNGTYWPDRWAPPADVQMTATRKGNTVTYEIYVVNEGATDMKDVTLRDTLPSGLTYDESGVPALGDNPGKWSGSTVEWDTQVPWGTKVGPFIIVTSAQGATVPPNVAQISFSWTDLGGNTQDSTAVSAKVTPPVPTAVPVARRVAKATPAAVAKAPKPAATAKPVASPVTATGVTTSTEATATPEPTAAPTAAPTATTAPAGNAAAGQQLFATGTCVACHTINGVGGKVGPDLSHIGSTPYDSVGNDPATLNAWLHDPASVKADAKMPKPTLTDAQINDLVAYLTSLK